MNSPHLLAIEIGGSKLQLFAGTEGGRIADRQRFTVERAAGGDGIRAQIADALPALIERWQPQAIGVGYGGPVDWRTGRIVRSHHLAGWEDFPLGDWLAEQAGLPVFVENDANTAALGEALHGAGTGCSQIFYVTLGSGVGGGLVMEGNIFHGAPPGEVEIGHVRLDRAGVIVEDRCSGWAIDRRIRREAVAHPASTLAVAVGVTSTPGGEARHLGPALAVGDRLARQIVWESMADLAFGLSHVTHLLHPEIIVLGGGLALLGEPLRAAVAEALPGFLMEAFLPGPRVALSALGEDAVPIGALALAASRLANRPSSPA